MPTTVITANARRVGHPPTPNPEHTFKRPNHLGQVQIKRPFGLALYARTKTGFSRRSPANRHEPWFAINQARRHRRLLIWRDWLVGVVRLQVTSSRCPFKAWHTNANCLFLPIYCPVSQVTLFNLFSILHKPQEQYSEKFQKKPINQPQNQIQWQTNSAVSIPPSAHQFSTNPAL